MGLFYSFRPSRRGESTSSKSAKFRAEALVGVWNELISSWESGENVTREKAMEALKAEYLRLSISPIKGSVEPTDLYDKELTSLYIVGKYGMGLDEQYPEIFDAVFPMESKIESSIDALLGEEPTKAKDKVLALLGEVDGNIVARLLRMALTKIYFGFAGDDLMKRLSDALSAAFPERAEDVNRFLRFYAAFRVALAIEQGEARDRVTKEAFKHAMAIQLGRGKETLPSDEYVAKIASEVLKVPTKVLRQVLSLRGSREAT
ncbi:MAG: DUF2192 domain-containing protein [Acidilobus sp.]